ncbi:ZN414 protein, partial [Amia calva]|nr:ZN414 protein [Amia calva]
GKLFRCSTLGCTGTFSSMEQLMEHMGNHYKPNRYFVCESCSARLHSHRAFFKHLHICSKVAKNKTSQKLEKVRAVTATEVTECTSKPAVAATSNTAASLSVQSFVREVKKEPAAVPLAPLAPLPPLSGHTAPSAVPALPCSLPSLQASLSSLPLTTLPSNPFSQLQPSMLGAPSMPFTSQTQTEALPTPFLSYMPPTSFSLPQAVVQQQRLRALAPSQPALPVSNAVWKKNQGQSFNSRIIWEHTRGRYNCLQCEHSTPSRQEMTIHIEEQHKSPSNRSHGDMDFGVGLASLHSKLSPEMENSLFSQL